jgi:hypothetical protein
VITRRRADRRAGRRFDIVGGLQATLDLHPIEAADAAAPADAVRGVIVDVLDIGPGGVLLASATPPRPGQRGRLCLPLNTGAVVADVEVRHIILEFGQPGAGRAGAAFERLDDDSRRNLERFLTTSTE